MIKLGLTGPSGAGKTEFAKLLAQNGFFHIDCDILARKIVEKGRPARSLLVSSFGEGILNADGTLCRPALAKMAFSDPEKLSLLNRITHREILAEASLLCAEAEKKGMRGAILDAAALLESGFDQNCDAVCVVLAPRKVRLARILSRDAGITEEAAALRIDAQKPDSFYRKHADFVVENCGSFSALKQRAEEIAAALTGGTL